MCETFHLVEEEGREINFLKKFNIQKNIQLVIDFMTGCMFFI